MHFQNSHQFLLHLLDPFFLLFLDFLDVFFWVCGITTIRISFTFWFIHWEKMGKRTHNHADRHFELYIFLCIFLFLQNLIRVKLIIWYFNWYTKNSFFIPGKQFQHLLNSTLNYLLYIFFPISTFLQLSIFSI